jgi:hypothetical protein
MTRTIGKLADRLLSAVVPQTTAAAETETKCVKCAPSSSNYNIKCTRYCFGSCGPWYCGQCKYGCS